MNESNEKDADGRGPEAPDRRRFLDWLTRGFLALWGVGFLWLVSHFLKPPRSRSDLSERVLRIGPVDSIAVGTAKLIQHGSDPVWVVRTDTDTFIGLAGVCTHLRCVLGWDADDQSLVCPCHDGAFDLNGNVLKGPPPTSLKRYRVRTQLGEIFLHV